jgi:hypothetical protein
MLGKRKYTFSEASLSANMHLPSFGTNWLLRTVFVRQWINQCSRAHESTSGHECSKGQLQFPQNFQKVLGSFFSHPSLWGKISNMHKRVVARRSQWASGTLRARETESLWFSFHFLQIALTDTFPVRYSDSTILLDTDATNASPSLFFNESLGPIVRMGSAPPTIWVEEDAEVPFRQQNWDHSKTLHGVWLQWSKIDSTRSEFFLGKYEEPAVSAKVIPPTYNNHARPSFSGNFPATQPFHCNRVLLTFYSDGASSYVRIPSFQISEYQSRGRSLIDSS